MGRSMKSQFSFSVSVLIVVPFGTPVSSVVRDLVRALAAVTTVTIQSVGDGGMRPTLTSRCIYQRKWIGIGSSGRVLVMGGFSGTSTRGPQTNNTLLLALPTRLNVSARAIVIATNRSTTKRSQLPCSSGCERESDQ